ncbi:MAG: TonB-dependent receptor plug domain-containing protein [Spirochaetota bacterium]
MRCFTIILFLLFIPLFLLPGYAQTKEISLEDIVVSAYKSGITYGQSTGATVITQKDIEQGGYKFVSDVLQHVGGINFVQNGTLGGNTSIFIRGAKTGNVLVLIDGVKVNDPSTIERTFDFATLTTDSIERIEIIKGPQSALYGSDATGGIINIVTKRGVGKPTVTLNVYGGSYYTAQQSANISGGSTDFNYSLTIGQIASQGISKAAKSKTTTKPYDDDPFYQYYMLGKFGFAPISTLTIDTGFSAKHSDIALDDGAFVDDPNNKEKRNEVSGYSTITHHLSSFWKHIIRINASRTKRSYSDFDDDANGYNDFANDSVYTGSGFFGEWLHEFCFKDINTLGAGISYEKELSHIRDYLNPSNIKQDNYTVGVFAQDHVSIGSFAYLTAGARADKNHIFGWQQSYTISPAVVIPIVKTKIKGNWGKGYKAPSLYQIYGDGGTFVAENKTVKPEKSTSYDIGIEQPLASFATVSAAYFSNRYRDMIDYNSSSFPGYYYNIGKVTTWGYEASMTLMPIKFLGINGGYTYLKTKDETLDKPLLRRPTHQAFGSINIGNDRWSAECIVTYIGKRNDAYFDSSTFTTVELEMDSYIKTDIVAHYALTPQVSLTAKIENVTNKEYQQVVGYAMPQRSYYVGVKGIL